MNRILLANSDLSGISIFEEAQYHGVEAAQKSVERNSTVSSCKVPFLPGFSLVLFSGRRLSLPKAGTNMHCLEKRQLRWLSFRIQKR